MNEEIQKSALEISDSDATMETVLKNIYTSCDPHNLNMVPTSEIIEFIRPYLLGDLLALETLRTMLDPENKNVPVDGEQFYNVMNEWTKKIASHNEEDCDGEFNRTPNNLNIMDEKLLPYTQSTPRASFGQKLLSCQDLLNLSNVSNYNLSPTKHTKDNSIVVQERTILEEEVKQLQYELNKVSGEMSMLKVQLAYSEEQNENLQDELEKLKTRLQSEHQVNGHLQDNKSCLDDMKEEINIGKRRIEELNKKLTFYEKENNHLNKYVQKLEKENSELEDHCMQFSKMEQNLKKQLIDIKSELEVKEHELNSITKISEDLRLKLYEKNNEVDQLLNENELLDYKKQGLEKIISSRRYSLSSHYNTCLDEMSSFFTRGSTIPIYSSPLKGKSFYDNSPSLINKVLSPISPNPADPKSEMLRKVLDSSTPKGTNRMGMRKAFSLNAMSTRSLPNIFNFERSTVIQDQGSDADMMLESLPPDLGINGPYESLQTELFQVDPLFDHRDKNRIELEYEEQILALKTENEALQKNLQVQERESKDKIMDLDQRVKALLSEKKSYEELTTIKERDKAETSKLLKDFEDRLGHMKQENIRLESELNKKESEIYEIKNKVDFESAYKSLEIEYSRKISQLEELQQFHEDDMIKVNNLTSKIRNLEKSLRENEVELQITKEKYKNKEILSQNIEQTANIVQAHVDGKTAIISELQKLNHEFKHKVEKLENDLSDKARQLVQLKEILRKEEEIKNKMWRDNQDLTSSLNVLTEDYQKILKEVGENDNIKKELKDEYNSILSTYHQEIEKNHELTCRISSQEKDFSEINSKYHEMKVKYHEEINKSLKFQEEISFLKNELKTIRESHKLFKDDLNKSLVEYHNNVQQLSSKLKDLQFENSILTADLNIEKQKHSKQCENSHSSKQIDVDEDMKKYVDGDASSDSSVISLGSEKSVYTNKNRSFEKQKLTIDRLREKLENLHEDLLNEKCKNEILKKRLCSKEEELQVTVNNTYSEKNSLQSVINDLSDRLKQQEDYYKHICNATNDKIRELSLKISQLDELHKNSLLTLSQKDSLLQRNFEMHEFNKVTIDRLTKSLQKFEFQHKNLTGDLNAKELSLKNVTLENQNLKHCATRLENQVLELSAKLSYQESALKTCESDLDKKNEELKALSIVLSDREDRIKTLTDTATDYEHKLSSILRELSEKDIDYTKLRNAFNDVQEQLLKTEKTLSDSKQNGRGTINTGKTQERVNADNTIDKISNFISVISDCCNDLNRAFIRFIEPWKRTIESDPHFKQLPSLKLCTSLEIADVLSVVVHNVRAVISLFDLLTSKIPFSMGDTSESHLAFLPNQQTKMLEPKTLKKFTLRPPKLQLNRPESPDSPGIEMESAILNENPESNSPDSQNLRTFQINEQGENCVHNSSNSCLPLLTFDLQLQDAFPHLTDTFLDKLGLHENSPKVKLSKDETEKLFTTFAIQVALDSRDIKDRLEKQKDICCLQHRKCLYLLKDISLRLREHNCIGATDPINPVFIMLEDFRYQMQEMMQAVGLFGVLTCENRMTKCWNLVTNYMAIIKKQSEYWKEQSSPNRENPAGNESAVSPEKGKSSDKCKNCDRGNSLMKTKKEAKELTRHSSCLSSFTHTFLWLSFLSLLIFVGVILVHWQCKMTTEHKLCPLDDFIKVLSQRVGTPPY